MKPPEYPAFLETWFDGIEVRGPEASDERLIEDLVQHAEFVRSPIRTSYVYPPIPDRNSDWCAYYEGTEEGGVYGWGSSEREAIKDLLERTE